MLHKLIASLWLVSRANCFVWANVVIFLFSMSACGTAPSPLLAPVSHESAAKYNLQLGLGYLQAGDMQRAKHKLLLAQKQAPRSATVQGAMGYFLEMTDDSQAAEAYYRKAVAFSDQAGAAQNNYGAFLCRHRRYQEAERYLLEAAQNPTYLNTALAYENAGLCAMQISDLAKAVVYFSKAVAQDPQRATSWLALAQIDYQQKDYARAQRYLGRYHQLSPEPSPDALLLAIQLARLLGNDEEAGRYTLILQTKYPNSAQYKALTKTPYVRAKKGQLYY